LLLQLIEQTVELVQKQQQATGTFSPFLAKLFPFALVVKVFLFLVQIFTSGYPDLAMLAHQSHLVVHPIDTFPQQLDTGGVAHLGFVAGGIFQHHMSLAHIWFPGSC
jgi:hypothetical protein